MGYVIGFCILITWSIYRIAIKLRKFFRSKLAAVKVKPVTKHENDKLILVENINRTKIKEVLIKLCNLYNQTSYVALPRLYEMDQNTFAVTFPYDIDFQTFCYAINFIKYPADIKCNPNVTGWITTPSEDSWITPQSSNKKAMIFLADEDEEGDNVFLTTQYNINYKMGFGSGYEKQLLTAPEKNYMSPTITISDLVNMRFEDFE